MPCSAPCLVVVLLLELYCGSSLGDIFVVAPFEFHAGWPLNTAVTVHKRVDSDVFVTATLTDKKLGNAVTTVSDSLSPGESKMFSMQVPDVVNASGNFELTVEASGGITYKQEREVTYNRNSSMVLVETDKAIYRPGQQVRIRVIHVNKKLAPVISPVTIFIENSLGSKLEEFKEVSSPTGVVEKTFQLSAFPSLGQWQVDVLFDDGAIHKTYFTVEEFVLPKFSVEVSTEPGFLVLEDRDRGAVIQVKSLYTYGKGVQGKCKVVLSLMSVRVVLNKELNEQGVAEFMDINWNSLLTRMMGEEATIVITAEVTDETGRTEAGETTLQVLRNRVKIEILKSSLTVVRLDLPANIKLRVSDQNGNPVGPVDLEVIITSNSMDTVEAELSVEEGQTDVTYNYVPRGSRDSSQGSQNGNIQVRLKSNKEVMASTSVYVYSSLYGQGVVVSPQEEKKSPVVGEVTRFQVAKDSKSTDQTLAFVVVSQGNIVESGAVVDDVISITPTEEMCPEGTLLVYMLAGQDRTEVVVDAIDLTPTKCFSKDVTVSFDAAETRAGTDARMYVDVNRLDGSNALPGVHDVYYLAVDKSIILLEGDTFLDQYEVSEGLGGLALRRSSISRFSGAEPHAAHNILHDMGLEVFSSAGLDEERSMDYYIDYWHDKMYNGQAQATNNKETVLTAPMEQQSNSKVRKEFPDTWLWGHGTTAENGRMSQMVTLPDTITNWVVSAFAINTEGLALSAAPFELTAFQLFFLTLNLPYSIKRGEVFVLRISVFNYRQGDVQAVVRLNRTSQFTVVDDPDTQGWVEKSVQLPAGRASSVEFTINASTLGMMDIHVEAEDQADGMKDEVIRKLLVKPEGEERSRAVTKAFILTTATELDYTFNLNWPVEKIVPGSRRVQVKVTGDVFGQALSNLQNLIRQPHGCGEQNMISTVPNIFGLTYIRSTKQLGLDEMEAQMLANMKTGYQRQVDSYRHKDGSYSAWGQKRSDGTSAPGSTWLTAFVIKSFAQAQKYILIDPEILSSGVNFLRSKQNLRSGDFVELGNVIHSEMQSGTGSGPGLTVYVLISMLEANNAMGSDSFNMGQQIQLAITYIKQNLNLRTLSDGTNKFLSAMAAYAMSLVPDPDTEVTALTEDLLAAVKAGGTPWDAETLPDEKVAAGERMTTRMPQSSSSLVEIASYYLLALTQLGRVGEGMPVMKYLQSQQNSFGGYRSTQDTVMGLQALSSYGALVAEAQPKGQVAITEPVSGQSFDVDVSGSRAVLLQIVDLPASTDTVQVKLTGGQNSIAVVKVVSTYYTLAGDDDQAPPDPEVEVYTKTSRVSTNVHNVEACIKSSQSLQYNGMFVTTLTLPSGERALDDPATILANNPHASKVETEEEAIHFYIDEAPGSGYCLQAQLERQVDFEVQKPGSAKIYPYYDPDMVKEVALSLEGSACVNDSCDKDSAVMLNMASFFLTVLICTLVSLLVCV